MTADHGTMTTHPASILHDYASLMHARTPAAPRGRAVTCAFCQVPGHAWRLSPLGSCVVSYRDAVFGGLV